MPSQYYMANNHTTQNRNPISEQYLESWLPGVVPVLKSKWADYLFARPVARRLPSLGDWLALLHAGATDRDQIPHFLAQLLNIRANSNEQQNDWAILVDLFGLTFDAANHVEENNATLKHLLLVQQRILAVAAELSEARKARPSTNILTRRALYLKTITYISQRFSTIQNLDELLDEVVVLIHDNFNYDYVNLFLLNQAKQVLRLRSAAWQGQQFSAKTRFEVKLSEGLIGQVAITGQTMLVKDVRKRENFIPLPTLPNVKSELAAPMLAGKNLLGVLDVQSDHVNAFSEDDRQIIHALADRISIAIDNIHLRAKLELRSRAQKLLQEDDLALDIDSDLTAMLKHMSRKITEVMEVDACVISQVDVRANLITPLAEYVVRYPGNPTHTWRKLDEPLHISKDPLAQQVLKTNRPTIQWANADKAADLQVWQIPASGYDTRQATWGVALVLPLGTKRGPIGLVELYGKNKNRRFSHEDIQIYRILARQASLSIERTKLLDEVYQRLSQVSLLYTMGQKLPDSFDLQEILNTVVQFMQKVMACRGASLYLLDSSETALEIKAAKGLKSRWREQKNQPLGQGPIGQAAAEARPVHIPDIRKVSNVDVSDKEVRSLLVVPLLSRNKVIGALVIDDARPNAFDRSAQQTLKIAAGQVSVAIENARLLAKVADEQQHLHTITEHVNDGVLLINPQGRILTCNPPLSKLLDLHVSQIIGQNINSAGLTPQLQQITQPLAEAEAIELVLNSLSRPLIQLRAITVLDGNDSPIGEVRIIQDITENQLSLNETYDDSIEMIAWRLDPLVLAIREAADTLVEDQSLEALDKATHQKLLARIQDEANELHTTLDNLSAVAVAEDTVTIEATPVSIRKLVNRATLGLQTVAHQQQVTLVTQLPDTLPMVQGDAQRLEQVMTHLIGNAIKHSRFDGHVIINASLLNEQIQVTVKDSGVGIASQKLKTLFTKAPLRDRVSPRALSIVQQIVQKHGGRIWVESTVGEGTEFYFTLPLSKI
ncbi:GAF domain-containing protein [Anaerolineales bacterium HSG6]|nr:GAF domain-containing protein [Anaerolineales bacterium HSG6]